MYVYRSVKVTQRTVTNLDIITVEQFMKLMRLGEIQLSETFSTDV